ncbi:putative PLP-dependent enzyme possibly involved in cell wall biogenesis [Schinkia azotoformans MEV2011]|uniref:Putative PLP-dependent enzyme possibly involved in cell wall biogenesis n=1 Tax=Schinkia azotoformans MEV2011 TaxID=1348973 RepID=A0A072NPM7_SCHAZ|nr:DegT/DnrJ/EryC1/StrS family aminotransferase [Schinkia azotoformans]KEF38883.1 putative PLP-dependent enzyme possibly involved in cell wall biogenesis [Schinkia azotoformans MEV2011]MEC1696787.1 DegT/DnrJ/EryC1/StrS family aminotransferase [Schinkia azotoformans]MEC1725004.1 DegT/DnrJ/EryC1/StrS family aminotransferase [Schinkia azotoformans]MEC1741761.1 DegT/DnrJ/EryC1/StrS family aminotransferase [Schinkia azotoformans]MEC1766561.1 DegT/DnrJ/EryC1/StrS family aminotransferase [Schinkia az
MKRNSIPVVEPSMPPYEEYINEIKNLWDNRWLTHTGPKHQALENGLCEFLGVDNISLFANGHLALEIAINGLQLTGEIITTPFTFASTTQAIVRNKLTPVFCDINENDYTIDVTKIEELITENTSAILPVHVYGNICDVHKIEEIANKYNLKVIYDAAHAFGIKLGNTPVGNFGDVSMFSFHATKVFHTVEGGGLTYQDPKYKDIFAKIRQFGMEGQESVPIVGTNAKMTEIHAAMGLCNLRHITEEIAKRGLAMNRYRELLTGVKGIRLCEVQENVTPNYSYFPVLFNKDEFGKDRDEVADLLAKNNIFARKYFYPLTNGFSAYKDMFQIQETHIAKKIADNILTLPLYSDLSLEEVEQICKVILE